MDASPFLWGVATSAFQIEGQVENDMTEWERTGRFQRDGRNPRYDDAANHWERWEEDFRLLCDLGVNAYRFSVEWARIEPRRGCLCQSALDQYSRMVDKLLEYSISPMITLHHFTHPTWFHDLTPWHHPESVEAFASFVEVVARKLADRVNLFVTLNEPLAWVLAAYGDAQFPPGEKNIIRMMDALRNLLEAHRRAYDIVKNSNPVSAVGIANNFIVFKPARSWNPLDRGLTKLLHGFYNVMILEAFRTNRLHYRFPMLLNYDQPVRLDDRIDFWGVNYYYRAHVRFQFNRTRPFNLLFLNRSGEGITDLGWETYSEGLLLTLRLVSQTEKPMYITENGIATTDDCKRIEFIRLHLDHVSGAVAEGLDVRGYFHWSLLDNYEWLVGNSARFGLFSVDFGNGLERKPTEAGKYYARLISQANGAP
jgi:beta-glucosidase